MDLPPSHIQERLHEAYVRTVVAMAGLSLVVHSEREYGVDCHIQDIKQLSNGQITESGPRAIFMSSYHIATMCKPGPGICRSDALYGVGDGLL
jgi:hypothetical protein